MLEGIGFKYINEVDPFDGGPHYRAVLKEITPIQNIMSGTISSSRTFKEKESYHLMISIPCDEGEFLGAKVVANIIKEKSKILIILSPEDEENLDLDENIQTSAILI